jgi:uncharacterized OsmC-like protein
VTLVGVSREFDIPLRRVEVRISHKQNLLVGPNDPRQRELRIAHFSRQIKAWGPIEDAQRERLRWGAEHCPVHNSIRAAIPIDTTIEIASEEVPTVA